MCDLFPSQVLLNLVPDLYLGSIISCDRTLCAFIFTDLFCFYFFTDLVFNGYFEVIFKKILLHRSSSVLGNV